MNHIALVRLSSLGDVLHTIPAIEAAYQANPNLEITWLVEPAFQEVASWHPAVKFVIPIPLRGLKHHGLRQTWQTIQAHTKDLPVFEGVLDSQGLVKSSVIAKLLKGPRHGLGFTAAREPLAALGYHHRYAISPEQHAIVKNQALFAAMLGFTQPKQVHYGLKLPTLMAPESFSEKLSSAYWVFFVNTTWDNKHWLDTHWISLGQRCAAHGPILLPWGSQEEKHRVSQIAKVIGDQAIVLPERVNFSALASLIRQSRAVVSVDTGLSHLTAALEVPQLTLYGPTSPLKTGTLGQQQTHLSLSLDCQPCLKRTCQVPLVDGQAPCQQGLSPELAWEKLSKLTT